MKKINWSFFETELRRPNILLSVYVFSFFICIFFYLFSEHPESSVFDNLYNYTRICAVFGILGCIVKMFIMVVQRRRYLDLEVNENNKTQEEFQQKSEMYKTVDNNNNSSEQNKKKESFKSLSNKEYREQLRFLFIIILVMDFLYFGFFTVLNRTILRIAQVRDDKGMHAHTWVFLASLFGSVIVYTSIIITYKIKNIDKDLKDSFNKGENELILNFLMDQHNSQ